MKGGKTLWMQPNFQNATVKVSETDPRHQAVSMRWSNLEDGQEKSNDQPHDTPSSLRMQSIILFP